MAINGRPNRPVISRRLMVFVDGENLALRIEALQRVLGKRYSLPQSHFLESGVAFWAAQLSTGAFGLPERRVVRVNYYTACSGDLPKIQSLRETLQRLGVGHTWVHKKKKGQKSKAVDIQLATDLLMSAANGQADDIVLVSADADFLPVVQRGKQLGCQLFLSFPGLQCGRHPRGVKADSVKDAIGLSIPSDYSLAFDRLLDRFAWFQFNPLSGDELQDVFDKILRPVLPESITVQPTIRGGALGASFSGGINVELHANGSLRLSVDGTAGTKSGSLSLWPDESIHDRLKTALTDLREKDQP